MQSVIALAGDPSTTLDALEAALRAIDQGQLERNAFHVIQAIPEQDEPAAYLRVGLVHHVIGKDDMPLYSILDTVVRGQMADVDAERVVRVMLERNWLARKPLSTLLHACAKNKVATARLLHGYNFYQSALTHDGILEHIPVQQIDALFKNLVDIVDPSTEDFVRARSHADPHPKRRTTYSPEMVKKLEDIIASRGEAAHSARLH